MAQEIAGKPGAHWVCAIVHRCRVLEMPFTSYLANCMTTGICFASIH